MKQNTEKSNIAEVLAQFIFSEVLGEA